MDRPIELEELLLALNKCKKNKAPGEDGLAYEFFKGLPENWLYYIVFMFNKVMILQMTPDEWSNIIIKMLYKNKGDKMNLDNYRPLALANCLAKIFTQILYARAVEWCNRNNSLPIWQAGFREDYSCLDNIYTLNSIIQLKLRQDKGKLYALFIDFKSAFNTVNHDLLWQKLKDIGFSSKFIRILSSLYSKAKIKISDFNELSESIKVSIGVLQGEILSPLLFALFLYDLEDFLLKKGVRGVSVSHLIEVLLMAYADDIVIIADTYIYMKKVLKYFYEYCKINKLTVNLNKTKIILFQKGGHAHKFKKEPFHYGTEKVEYVKEYTYLGVAFTQAGTFECATQQFVKKAKNASAAVISLISKVQINSFETYQKIFELLAKSIMIYA